MTSFERRSLLQALRTARATRSTLYKAHLSCDWIYPVAEAHQLAVELEFRIHRILLSDQTPEQTEATNAP